MKHSDKARLDYLDKTMGSSVCPSIAEGWKTVDPDGNDIAFHKDLREALDCAIDTERKERGK